LFAVHAGLIFPRAKIICFEPDRKNFEMLLKNLEQNNIKADCLQRGVWSSKISGYFHCRQAFDGFISLDPSEFPVECEVPQISSQTWLKMDIEGGEYEVLPTIMSSDILPKHISMEIHDFYVRGERLTNLMKSMGYELHIVTDGSNEPAFAEVTARQININQ
jgi:FkbM family methyltransferase